MGSHNQKNPKFLLTKTVGAVLLLALLGSGAKAETEPALEKKAEETGENIAPQVRYRTRPVASFRSGAKSTSSNVTSNSTDPDGPEAPGVPFITVHDLTSQTFEKLHENWRNLEALIRNYQSRKTQEESLRSPSEGVSVPRASSGERETVRRPPYNNVYTFRYHPVVLQGEGSSSVDDIVGNSRHGSNRNWNNGISFNPYPYDPKGEGSKDIDMERHTVATMYTIGICLIIMVIGSMMFILINKCDGGGGSYTRTSASSRITSRVMAIGRTGRQANSGSNGRTRNARSGRNNESTQSSSSSGNDHNSSAAKYAADLPPSYASLFPEGEPKIPPNDSRTDNTPAHVNDESSAINLNSSGTTSGQSDNISDSSPTIVATST